MKQLLPVALSLLIVACAPPKPGTVAHQRQLADEARENFYALKEQERRSRPGAAVAQEEARPARVRLKPFAPAKPAPRDTVYAAETPEPRAAKPKPTPPPKKPSLFAATKPKPTPKPKPTTSLWAKKPAPKRADDTVYIFDVPTAVKEPRSKRYLAYKAQYAEALGKRPENLSRKELEWVRTHYRD